LGLRRIPRTVDLGKEGSYAFYASLILLTTEAILDMKTKNVLIVSGFLKDTYTSIERQYVEFTRDQNCNAGMSFYWLVPTISNKKQLAETRNDYLYVEKLKDIEAKIIRADLSAKRIISSYLQLRKILKQYKIDLVWTHFGVERYLGLILGKLAGVKTALNVHGEYFAEWRKGVLLKKICVFLFADAFIAVSEAMATPFRSYGKTMVLANSFIPDSFPDIGEEDKERFRKKYGIAKGKKVICMVAAFRQEKRHILAVDILEGVHKRHPEACLFLAGDGPELDNVAKYVVEKQLDDHIILSGHISELNELYSISVVSLLTSRIEPFGMVILEAMYKKLPVVAENSGGPAEIIENQQDGFLVEPDDTKAFVEIVDRLLEDENVRAEVGKNAKQKVVNDYLFGSWRTKQCDILSSILE